MASSEPLQIEIQIDPRVSPISGRWCQQGSQPRPFTGWTELFAALDVAVSDARASSDSGELRVTSEEREIERERR